MRFRTELKNIKTFSKLTAALGSLEKIAWVRLSDDTVRFTVIPDMGSQVWASLSMDFLFGKYIIQSNEENNNIDLELPLQPLQRALKSARDGMSATLGLTKSDGIPVLRMTIKTTTSNSANGPSSTKPPTDDPYADPDDEVFQKEHLETPSVGSTRRSSRRTSPCESSTPRS
ncbi:hypothetical protein V2G26_003184 [Clonostachys chloroleuca]